MFAQELLHVLDLLRANPNLGTRYEAARFGETVRRILMPKAESHVYVAHVDNDVVILAIWGARRRRGPQL